MPASRPRMHVTPSESVHALLAEMQRLTGKPPATIVREFLDEAVPALETAVEALRMLKERPQAAMQAVDRMLDTAMLGAAQARLDLDKAMNAKPGRKVRKAASVSRAASPRAKQGQGAAKTG